MSQLTPFRCRTASLSPVARLASSLSLAILSSSGLWAEPAEAHIELMEPAPRYDGESNKSCPCGEGPSDRTCNTSAADTTDPNRNAQRVTEYEAGSTITVYFDEYINHQGRFRVAFDPEGADQSDFNANVLADVPDPNDAAGPRQLQVTLPDTPCDNCTLQLVQAMNNDEVNPVINPGDFSTYYTCADIRLVAAGEAETDGEGDSSEANPAEGPDVGDQPDSGEGAEPQPDDEANTNAGTEAIEGDADLNQQADLPDDSPAGPSADTEELTGDESSEAEATASAGGLESSPNLMDQEVAVNAPILIGMPMERQSSPSASGGGCTVAQGAAGYASRWSLLGLVGLVGLGLRRRARR